MKKLVCALALVALFLPATASAKELQKVEVCGPDGCAAITGHDDLSYFSTAEDSSGAPPGAAPYYELRYTVDAESETVHWSAWYVPSAKMMASVDERQGVMWSRLDAAPLAAAVKKVKPFPKPEVTSVTIGTRRVKADPESYLRLFSVESSGEAVPQGLADWQPVVFHSRAKTPWTLEQTSLYYSPANNMVQRGIDMVKIPGSMAADVEAGRSLADGSSIPWKPALIALLAALLLVAATRLVRPVRRRLEVRRAPSPA